MTQVPPLAAAFGLKDLAALDDEALRTCLRPSSRGLALAQIGLALRGARWDGLAARVESALPPGSARAVHRARAAESPPDCVERARRHLVDSLFWPLLYWHLPERYEELVDGEDIDPRLVDGIALRDRVVADVGAGAGRFALAAARWARQVIAVDPVPALLGLLERRAREAGLDNIETRRGCFESLPLRTGEVDVAVACSSMGSRPPAGGAAALRRVVSAVRPGGDVWVIWPDDPLWFCARGFHFVQSPPPATRRFRSREAALRVCRDFYGDRAVRWVAEHGADAVPYRELGLRPPADACVLRITRGHLGEDDLVVERPHPGVQVR